MNQNAILNYMKMSVPKEGEKTFVELNSSEKIIMNPNGIVAISKEGHVEPISIHT